MDTRLHRSMPTETWIRLRRKFRFRLHGRSGNQHEQPYQPSEMAVSYRPEDVSISVGEG